MDVKTIKIVAENEHGFIIINESDRKPEHKLFSDNVEVAEAFPTVVEGDSLSKDLISKGKGSVKG